MMELKQQPFKDLEYADQENTFLSQTVNETKDRTPSDSSHSGSDVSTREREKWGSQFEFILACVGYSVAYGNILRFPYLVMRNGGGAFLVPFFFFMIVCGFPLYFLEVCLGQFSGSSPLFVWRLAPLLKGLGWLMILFSAIVSWYYNTIIAWVLYYLVNSFKSQLPWATCDNPWNTQFCRPSSPDAQVKVNVSMAAGIVANNGSDVYTTGEVVQNISSAKEFWQHNVLVMSDGIGDVGRVQWHLVLASLGAWLLVFLCLIKGVKSIGKVVYVTAILPYVLLVVFLIRGLTLPGSMDGVRFYLTTDFHRLCDTQVWLEAAVQVCYSLGPVYGAVVTMASFNQFHTNCLRDSMIACLADCLTSFFAGFVVFAVVGYMAHELNQPIDVVATSGPGLMFIAYPEAISRMPIPHLWAVLFFVMLIAVGLDTQFGMFETVSSGIVDAFPDKLARRKTWVVAALAGAMFLASLPFTTNAGIYIYNLIDWYASTIAVTLGGALECLAVGWYYGAERFSQDMELMLGYRAPLILRLCWCVFSPLILLLVMVIMLAKYERVTYEGAAYPDFAVTIGILVGMVTVVAIPIVAVVEVIRTPGTIKERISTLMKPQNWRPSERKYWDTYKATPRPRPRGIVDYATLNLLGRRETYILR